MEMGHGRRRFIEVESMVDHERRMVENVNEWRPTKWYRGNKEELTKLVKKVEKPSKKSK